MPPAEWDKLWWSSSLAQYPPNPNLHLFVSIMFPGDRYSLLSLFNIIYKNTEIYKTTDGWRPTWERAPLGAIQPQGQPASSSIVMHFHTGI